ncbi:MAG: hypothetical protein KGH60_03305 [Candidatus Micrarchaeota archaeon]|nr:hypothetical protein [Candidatus Micrarchaeota archaeon]
MTTNKEMETRNKILSEMSSLANCYPLFRSDTKIKPVPESLNGSLSMMRNVDSKLTNLVNRCLRGTGKKPEGLKIDWSETKHQSAPYLEIHFELKAAGYDSPGQFSTISNKVLERMASSGYVDQGNRGMSIWFETSKFRFGVPPEKIYELAIS